MAALLLAQGGLIALGLILVDEVDNAYGDLYSGSVAGPQPAPRWSVRRWGISLAVLCTVLALFLPMHSLEPFMLMLSSVFVPLYGVILARLGGRPSVAALVGASRVNPRRGRDLGARGGHLPPLCQLRAPVGRCLAVAGADLPAGAPDASRAGRVAATRSVSSRVRASTLAAGCRPWRTCSRFSSVCRAMTSRSVRLAMCGVMVIRGSLQKRWSDGSGSLEKASSVAPADLAAGDRREQVVLDQVVAAADVDHMRAPRQAPEEVGAKESACLRGQGQQAHQGIAAGEEVVQLFGAVEDGHTRRHRRGSRRDARRARRSPTAASERAQALPSQPNPAMPTRWRRGETIGSSCQRRCAAWAR